VIGTPVQPPTYRSKGDTASTADQTLPDGRSPIEAFAERFDNAEGKPLMAIVLIDGRLPSIPRFPTPPSG